MAEYAKLASLQFFSEEKRADGKLLFLFNFGVVNGSPIGGYGVYQDEEVLFWVTDNKTQDKKAPRKEKYHIFKITDEWKEKIKEDQCQYRESCGYRNDYGPVFEKRFDFDDEKISNQPFMRSYKMEDIDAIYLGFVQSPDIINFGPCDPVNESMLKYFD